MVCFYDQHLRTDVVGNPLESDWSLTRFSSCYCHGGCIYIIYYQRNGKRSNEGGAKGLRPKCDRSRIAPTVFVKNVLMDRLNGVTD